MIQAQLSRCWPREPIPTSANCLRTPVHYGLLCWNDCAAITRRRISFRLRCSQPSTGGKMRFGAVVIPPPHNFALVRALVDGGANVNVSDVSGNTPLLLAASRGQRDVVRYLIEHGANVDAKDKDGNTPLSYVATWHYLPGDPDIVNALLDRGANINGAYHLGTTPLMFALQTGNSTTVRLLLTRHADVNRRNSQGISALSLAQNSSDNEVITLLKQAGAK